jgi:hypothetical protein
VLRHAERIQEEDFIKEFDRGSDINSIIILRDTDINSDSNSGSSDHKEDE